MKKLVFVLVIALFAINYSYAQTTEALTNSIIIKMAKAKLSDDLIIEEINSNKVNFDISADSIRYLSEKNVSPRVIQAMRTANGAQTSTIVTTANTPLKELPDEKIVIENSIRNLNDKSSISVNAIGYVIPLAELMIFYDNEFNSMAGHLQGWDEQIRNYIEKGNQIKEKIRQVEKELTEKKNSDSKGFTTEIISLKNKLAEYRESNKQFENNMVKDGLRIVKEIDYMGSELDKSINKKFSDIGQIVKKTDPDPSVVEDPKSVTIPKQIINDNIVFHIASATEMLFFYQNEIISLRNIIELWNTKVMTINKKDADLRKQSEPLEKELNNLQLNPKENKNEISALKKQCTNIEKERKLLSRQMGTDIKELSGFLSEICKEVQSTVKERLSDIIENIKYSYQDNFTYRDI